MLTRYHYRLLSRLLRSWLCVLILAWLVLAPAAPVRRAQAAALTVTNTADSGPGSLRQAIADALPGATITFTLPPSSTIRLTSGELTIDKDLTIIGSGLDNPVISGNNASRVVNIAASTAVT